MRKIAMMMMLLFTMTGSVLAQDDYYESTKFKRGIFDHVAVNAGVGVEGISVGVAAPLTNFFELEAGVNFMPGFNLKGDLEIPQQTISVRDNQGNQQTITTPSDAKVNAEGSFSRTTVNVKAFIYPFGGSSKWFLAAGFSMGGKKIVKLSGSSPSLRNFAAQYPEYSKEIIDAVSANLAGYNVRFTDNFAVDGDIRCKGFRPYLGLGFGRAVPKNRIGFRYEIGCQFMGRLKVFQDGEELNLDKIMEDAGGDDLSKLVRDLKFYPCLKLSVVGRIL